MVGNYNLLGVQRNTTMMQYLSIWHRLCKSTFLKLLRLKLYQCIFLIPKLNTSHLLEPTYQVFFLCCFQPALGGPEIEVGRTEPDKTDYVKDRWIPDFWRETMKCVKTTEIRSHFHQCIGKISVSLLFGKVSNTSGQKIINSTYVWFDLGHSIKYATSPDQYTWLHKKLSCRKSNYLYYLYTWNIISQVLPIKFWQRTSCWLFVGAW